MSLITAIILLLVLAALGAFIVSFGTVQQLDSALDFQGSQAYHAARSGLEYGAFQAINNGSCLASTQVALPAAQFGPFNTVTVSCSTQGAPAPAGHNEAGVAKVLFALTADACNQPAGGVCPNPAPGANYVERELQLTVINPP